MNGPFITPPFKPGDDIRNIRPELEKMRRELQALKPVRSAKVIPRRTADGTMLDVIGSAQASPQPFEISITTGPLAVFSPGTVNGMLPSNYLTGVSIPASGTRYITLDCTASNGSITAVAFVASASAPAGIQPYAGQPPVAFSVLIYVVTDLVATRVWGAGNIQAAAAESFRLQKATPVAGQVPYDIYYTWNLAVL